MCLVFTEPNNVACNNVNKPYDCVKDVIVEEKDSVIKHSAEKYTTKMKYTG